MKVKYTQIGTCLMCQKTPCQCNLEKCCVCGETSEYKCKHCGIGYCEQHYITTVITGNCCLDNENDYNL